MPKLSQRTLLEVSRDAFKTNGLRPFFMNLDGTTHPEEDPLAGNSKVRKLRIYALHESINLGEPCFFDILPGLMSWIVALEDRRIIHGALIGGEVLSDTDREEPDRCSRELASMGFPPHAARQYISTRLVFTPAAMRSAARNLHDNFYRISGWKPIQMEENRLRIHQQRQIAEAIEDRKKRGDTTTYPFEKERILLSHIRSGDPDGARRVLNEMLGAMYLSSPKLAVLRARAIEMMGYLTRAAVEDSPVMEPLIERNHRWMERLIQAKDFEALARVLTSALNDFIEGIYLHGFNRSNSSVSKALDFITKNHTKPLSLADVARHVGLSSYRIAHLVKAHTGKTILQIILHARVQSARSLLENSDKSCTDIAYETGFNDQSYFIKHFKRLTGITPARYRRNRMTKPG